MNIPNILCTAVIMYFIRHYFSISFNPLGNMKLSKEFKERNNTWKWCNYTLTGTFERNRKKPCSGHILPKAVGTPVARNRRRGRTKEKRAGWRR